VSRDHVALHRLAERVGILPEYVDQTGTEVRRTSDDTRVAFLLAMGFDATTRSGIRHALEALDARERSQVVPPVRVLVPERGNPAGANLRLPEAAGSTASWQATLSLEAGERRRLEGTVELDAPVPDVSPAAAARRVPRSRSRDRARRGA
jgi:hypothetical protein